MSPEIRQGGLSPAVKASFIPQSNAEPPTPDMKLEHEGPEFSVASTGVDAGAPHSENRKAVKG